MKRLISFLIYVAVIMATKSNAFAQISTWDGTAAPWIQGIGTEDSPFLIENAQNLAYIAVMANNGTQYENEYFKLTIDIDLDNLDWMPIGNYNNENAIFKGSLDGDSHTINNLKINSSSLIYGGLFGRTQDASISNLNISGSIIGSNISNNQSYYGGIIGYAYNTNLSNCNSSIDVYLSATHYSFAGGIVGYSEYGIYVYNCNNSGTIYSYARSSAESYSGGIIGFALGYIDISDCYNTGYIHSTLSGSFQDNGSKSYSGGLVGYYNQGNQGIIGNIFKSYNLGQVSSESPSSSGQYGGYSKSYAGGLVGYGPICISNCYNCGNISSLATHSHYDQAYEYASGIGHNCWQIISCYNAGSLTAPATNCSNIYKYGIGQEVPNQTITNCYYLESCGGNEGVGISKTDTEMKSSSFPDILNADVFVMDLTPNVNDGYPIFGSSICKVTTEHATNLNYTSATFNGKYTNGELWNGTVDTQGFEWKLVSAEEWDTVYTNVESNVSYNLTGLTIDTTYSYRMFVRIGDLTIYGNIVEFATLPCDITATISPESATICENETQTVAVTSSCGVCSYMWSNEATTSEIPITQEGTYTVVVTDEFGCSATASTTIAVNEAPSPEISGNILICDGESTELIATGGVSYVWNTDLQEQSINVSEAGTYSVIVTDNNGCSAMASITIALQPINITVESADDTMGNCHGSGIYNCGVETQISATPEEHYHFVSWNDGNTENPRTITVECDTTFTANFAIDQFTIIVESADLEMGTVSEGGTYDYGTEIQITATANDGYRFLSWSDNSTENPHYITVTENAMYIATFEVDNSQQPIYVTINETACGSYTWNDSTYTQSGEYQQTFTASTSVDSIVTLVLEIFPLPEPEITASDILDACNPSSVTLSAGNYSTYTWNTGESTETISVTEPGNYYVEVVDGHGCHGYSEMLEVGYSNTLTEAPQLRRVGMSNTGTNIVQWTVANTEGIAGFEIYREDNIANVYTLIQRVDRPGVRSCTDVTANPSARAYRYKICAVDECGGLSPLSEPHKTMHLTINRGIGNTWNLIWSPYEGMEFASYKIYRGTTVQNMVVIGEVPSTMNTFTDSDNPNSTGFFYKVVTVANTRSDDEDEMLLGSNIVDNGLMPEYTITAVSANPNQGTVVGGGTYPEGSLVALAAIPTDGYEFLSWSDESTENPHYITVTGNAVYVATFVPSTDIKDNALPKIALFPNPATDILNITSSETISEIEIVNVMGQIVKRMEVNCDTALCDVEDLKAGVYIVKISTASATLSIQKFAKE